MIMIKQSLLGDEACSNSRWISNVVSEAALDIIISSRIARVLYTNKSYPRDGSPLKRIMYF